MLNKELRTKLDELEEWFKDNPKLPQEINRILLRRFLKCMFNDVEEAKKLIELHYGMRNKHPHIFIDRDPDDENIVKSRQATDLVSLPGLTPDGNKLIIYRLIDYDPKKLNNLEECKIYHMLADCRFAQVDVEKSTSEQQPDVADDVEQGEDDELAKGEVHITDIAGQTMGHVARLSFSLFRAHMRFLQEAYPVRLRALHVINCPPFLNKMLAIVRPFIHDDVFKLIHFHSDGLGSLYDHVPREMLPVEYGGSGGTMAELKEHSTQELKKGKDYLMDPNQWKVEQTAGRGRWYWF